MDYSKLLTIFGLIFNTIAAVILISPYLNIKKRVDDDYITSMDKDGRYTQKKHLKERCINMWGLAFLAIGFILQLISVVSVEKNYKYFIDESDKLNLPNETLFKVEDNLQPTYDYLESSGCSYEMSNNSYTECAEKAFEKIKEVKISYFARFQDVMKENPNNTIVSDEKLNKEFFDWYKNSNDFNHLRCSAYIYWTGAGSAYKQNMATCQIFETQRDIQLLDELYTNKEYFRDWVKEVF